MGKQTTYEYSLKVLGETLHKEEKWLKKWRSIVDNPESEDLSLCQAKGNIPSNEYRVEELKKAIELLSPPRPEHESKKVESLS